MTNFRFLPLHLINRLCLNLLLSFSYFVNYAPCTCLLAAMRAPSARIYGKILPVFATPATPSSTRPSPLPSLSTRLCNLPAEVYPFRPHAVIVRHSSMPCERKAYLPIVLQIRPQCNTEDAPHRCTDAQINLICLLRASCSRRKFRKPRRPPTKASKQCDPVPEDATRMQRPPGGKAGVDLGRYA
ncbi:hypothetical protein BU24DRAFT_200769 [Aaosphaeria arxii CBS 175.79]|uniref:Uncharacterized protein n=1 Tax=Aaosphaeria arxii CBS 175.79 TaxID=1450172 RepID=A0A6A5XUJ4_9PLEO|nr:uncharacterized protein BU24DRAFT_200769 [Aaosphaeria arxii CBS 175.79]KAF2016381.1 hypothetical protein BU24DRAFT_200769 [Aaosphaeria arxii CBS 175.79]